MYSNVVRSQQNRAADFIRSKVNIPIALNKHIDFLILLVDPSAYIISKKHFEFNQNFSKKKNIKMKSMRLLFYDFRSK